MYHGLNFVTVSPRGRPKTPENTLRRRLHSLERTARQWQIRAQQLEQEKEMLRAQNGNMRKVSLKFTKFMFQNFTGLYFAQGLSVVNAQKLDPFITDL